MPSGNRSAGSRRRSRSGFRAPRAPAGARRKRPPDTKRQPVTLGDALEIPARLASHPCRGSRPRHGSRRFAGPPRRLHELVLGRHRTRAQNRQADSSRRIPFGRPASSRSTTPPSTCRSPSARASAAELARPSGSPSRREARVFSGDGIERRGRRLLGPLGERQPFPRIQLPFRDARALARARLPGRSPLRASPRAARATRSGSGRASR